MGWSPTTYYRPQRVSEVLRLLRHCASHAAVLAGGTQLVAARNPDIEVLVDIHALDLDYVRTRPRQLHIGALTRLETLARHPDVTRWAGGLLAQAAERRASRAIRNQSTLGGTLAVGDPLCELTLALLVLDASVIMRTPSCRVLPMADFCARRDELLSAPTLITEVLVPAPPTGTSAAMVSVRSTPLASPIITAAAQLCRAGETLRSARLALAGIAPEPRRIPSAEDLVTTADWDEALLAQVAQAVQESVGPPANASASADYRSTIAGVAAVRAMRQAWALGGEE